MAEIEKQVLTVRDVAAFMSFHPVTIRNMIRKYPAGWIRVGTYYRISKSNFEKWFKSLEEKTMQQGKV